MLSHSLRKNNMTNASRRTVKIKQCELLRFAHAETDQLSPPSIPSRDVEGANTEIDMKEMESSLTQETLWSGNGRITKQTRPVEILLVENDGDDVTLAREALAETKRAFKLYTVEDGVEALEFLHRDGEYANAVRPDLVLLDLHMPGMGGLEFLTRLKNDEKLKTIPVVILTASRDGSDVAASLNRGANAYLVKPMLFTELCHMLQDLLTFWFGVATFPQNE
jgi:two-component system response regulator